MKLTTALPCFLAMSVILLAAAGGYVTLAADFATLPFGNGYLLSNNTWNRDAAHGPHQQAIFSSTAGPKPSFGWTWRWPSADNVVSYPEVIYGDSPWDPTPSHRAADFPLRIGTRRVTVDYDISYQAQGICNFAFEFWAVSSLPASSSVITHEVMIWIDNKDMTPAGTWTDVFTLNGTTYDVFVREGHGDASGKNPQKWTYIAFLARKPVLRGPLDISAFAAFLRQKKLLGGKAYMTGLELGNEVITGSGRTEIRGYKVTVR